MDTLETILRCARAHLQPAPVAVYPRSLHPLPGGTVCMADFGHEDALLYLGEYCPFRPGTQIDLPDGTQLVRAELTHENAQLLRLQLPFTAPRRVLGEERTFGTGDRLGIATVGHIHAAEKYDLFPVFAQQSMRELNLMGNSYTSVIDRVTFQVFREDYTRGFGADGDHLKSAWEVKHALDSGCTMITLDCSEHIRKPAAQPPVTPSDELLRIYCSAPITVANHTVSFTPEELQQALWIYGEAIGFAQTIYETCISGRNADLEVSMDETDTPTSPAQHYFVANELTRRGIDFKTIAPRFIGEFQKGIDYIGDLSDFHREFQVHAAIARHFGYKLSIHSGSDKFAVYPTIGAETRGRYHVKTSGTSWLEAVRLVSMRDPELFREIYAYDQTVFQECRAYYHVSTELSQVPAIENMADADLPELLNHDHARQLLHITYGKVMNETLPDGSPRFSARLRALWREYREEYADLLERHIGKHLSLLFQ